MIFLGSKPKKIDSLLETTVQCRCFEVGTSHVFRKRQNHTVARNCTGKKYDPLWLIGKQLWLNRDKINTYNFLCDVAYYLHVFTRTNQMSQLHQSHLVPWKAGTRAPMTSCLWHVNQWGWVEGVVFQNDSFRPLPSIPPKARATKPVFGGRTGPGTNCYEPPP